MAIWERAERDPEIRLRRYKCPECGAFSLHIKHEAFAECANGCFICDESIIKEVLDDADFDGQFTQTELETEFI